MRRRLEQVVYVNDILVVDHGHDFQLGFDAFKLGGLLLDDLDGVLLPVLLAGT